MKFSDYVDSLTLVTLGYGEHFGNSGSSVCGLYLAPDGSYLFKDTSGKSYAHAYDPSGKTKCEGHVQWFVW